MQGRMLDSGRFYEQGAQVVDRDSILPNPCLVGLARIAFHQGDTAKAHQYVDKLTESVLTGVLPKGFPEYSAWVLLLEDAVHTNNRAAALQIAPQIETLAKSPRAYGNDYLFSFDDKDARIALKKNGFTDIGARLEPIFWNHETSATAHSERPRQSPVDEPSAP
jgi:hypothetical protein